MTIIDNIKSKTLKLRKQRSQLASIMQFHLAEVTKIGKANSNRDTTDDEAIQYLKKTVQKLKENEFADQDEIAVLENLLPKMVSEDDVKLFLENSGLDLSNKGTVMKAVREKYGSLVDMKMVSKLL